MTKPQYKVPSMEEIKRIPPNGFKVCSTFSGCGGSSLGYKMAGFRVLWANEFIPAAQETYEANHPTTILDKRDIREVTAEDILSATGLEVGELDLFDGSPPCKDFSMAGNRDWTSGKVKKYSDTKQRTDDLFDQYIRLLTGLQPKTFVAENVAGMEVGEAKKFLGDFEQDFFEKNDDNVLAKFQNAGYVVGYRILNAAQLGVPQARRRIIFVGVRRDLAKKHALEPVWPRPLPYGYTIRDAIPWIQKVTGRVGSGFERVECPVDAPMNSITAEGWKHERFEVEAETDITKYCTGREWDNVKIGEASEKYFQLVKADPDKPCPTICASHGSGGIASVVHPFEKRKWSIAELKRICGFPDDFILTGTFEKQWERLGRAVPPVMMKHVAATVRGEILRKIHL